MICSIYLFVLIVFTSSSKYGHFIFYYSYCMEHGFDKIKAASDLVCETCMRGNILDSSRDEPQKNIPHKVCCDLRKHVPNKRQKAVETGKVKFLSMEEVLRMSSGSLKNESVPSNSIASLSQSQRRPVASKTFNPDFNHIILKSNPNFTQSGFVKPPRHGGMQSSLKAGQQAAKTSNNSKGDECFRIFCMAFAIFFRNI